MPETDHIHERGVPVGATGQEFTAHWCIPCRKYHHAEWWGGYREALADVQAHGLPDHAERVARVLAIYGSLQGGTREAIIQVYFAPLESAS